MSYLSSLYRNLSYLRNQKGNIEAQLRTYNRRKGEVENLIRDLTNVSDGNYSSLNRYADKIVSSISYALKGTSRAGSIGNTVSAQKEKGSWSDGNISNALSGLRQELNSIVNKINSLNSELYSVNGSINNANNNIRYEERRLAEERRRQQEEARRKAQEAAQFGWR